MAKDNLTIYNKTNLDWKTIGAIIDDCELPKHNLSLIVFSINEKSYRMWIKKNKKSYTINLEEIKI